MFQVWANGHLATPLLMLSFVLVELPIQGLEMRDREQRLSERGGLLDCRLIEDRVLIGGSSVRYMDGTINLPT